MRSALWCAVSSGWGGGGLGGAKCPLPHPQDPLGALERDLALQMQIARAAHRLCREENISKQLRRRRKTAALKEEQKLKALEDTLLAERRALSAGGAGGAQGENGGLPSGGEGMCVAMGPRCTCTAVPRVVHAPKMLLCMGAPRSPTPRECTPIRPPPWERAPQTFIPVNEPQNFLSGRCSIPTDVPRPSSSCGCTLTGAPQRRTTPLCAPLCFVPGVCTAVWDAPRSHGRAWAGLWGWELPGALF